MKKKKGVVKKKKKLTMASKKLKATKKKKVNKKTTAKRKKKVLTTPKGYHSITPYLILQNAAKAIEFYKKAFSAKEALRMEQPGGKIGHAELKIGDAKIMLSDECPEMQARSPQAYGGSPMMIHLYVKNADVVIAKAVSLGAKITRATEDMFYGDRSGMIEDPFGYAWCVSTHIEDVTPAKLKASRSIIWEKISSEIMTTDV